MPPVQKGLLASERGPRLLEINLYIFSDVQVCELGWPFYNIVLVPLREFLDRF